MCISCVLRKNCSGINDEFIMEEIFLLLKNASTTDEDLPVFIQRVFQNKKKKSSTDSINS